MEKSGQFSDYLFAKMGPTNGSTPSVPTKNVTTEESDSPPVELTGLQKWLNNNLMLLVTLSGVVFGVILGELILLR